MPGFSKTKLSLSFVAVLSLFLWGHPSSALMIGYDLTPIGPDAVCFVGAGYPIYKDAAGTPVEYPNYKDSQGNLVAAEPDGTAIIIDPTTQEPVMNKTTGKPVVDTSVGHLTATDTIGIHEVCSGTLINPTQILTAGHCVTPLESDPNLRMKVLCGYKTPTATSQLLDFAKSHLTHAANQKPHLFSDSFKEVFIPASIYINPKYTVEAEAEADSTNNFAIINLPRASGIQPLTPLTPLQSISEFLQQPKSANGKPAFQCAGAGFGLDANNEPDTFQLGIITDNNMDIDMPYSPTPFGLMSTSLDVDVKPLPQDKSDVWYLLEKKKKQAAQLSEQAAEQAEDAAEQCDKDDAIKAADEAEYYQGVASKVMLSQMQTLNKWNLINASVMPGDSGGPLLCRDNANAPWKLVGVASVISMETVGFEKDKELEVGILNRWVTPNIAAVTKKVWPRDPSAPVIPSLNASQKLDSACPAGGNSNPNGPSFSLGGDGGGGDSGPSLGGGKGFSLRGFGAHSSKGGGN